MSYVLRLHREGNNTINGWGNSNKISTNALAEIEDPNGDSAKKEITSIPSPFARIALVKDAFKIVARKGIDGDTIHHKLVSDAFDVGQIFFNYDKMKDNFEIIVWEKERHLNELLDSSIDGHNLLGRTYSIFIKQDGKFYNFDKMDRIYLLNFKYGPRDMNIVGATSPATLFFTSANDLSYLSESIRFPNNDRPFDEQYAPLYKRDIEYQKFLYACRRRSDFAQRFPEVESYLAKNLEMCDPKTRRELSEVKLDQLNNIIQDVSIDGSPGNVVYIHNDIPMKQLAPDTGSIAQKSGFVLKATRNGAESPIPLVLPVGTYTKQVFYANSIWESDIKVPYADERSLGDRTLPGDGSKYPYVTISDFLADTIVRMPYEINNLNFFNGNFNGQECSYMLPLKDLFFKYFTPDFLAGQTADNKPNFEMRAHGAGVTVFLRIPVAAGYIEYTRAYFEGSDPSETASNNDGAIVEKKFGLGIMPLVKFPDKVDKHYRIAMFDKGRYDAELRFIAGSDEVGNTRIVRNEKNTTLNICSSETYAVENNFDYIKVCLDNDVEGWLVPIFKDGTGKAKFTFAIDFGTTNTHIEYCTADEPMPVSFKIAPSEMQMQRLHKEYFTDPDIRMGFIHDFVPPTVGEKDDNYSFPMRTVFSIHKMADLNRTTIPMGDGNIPFLYEKEPTLGYNLAKTDLKWGGVPDKLVEMDIETIFILLRNKVVLNCGDLQATKIVWFYPASMTRSRISRFQKMWEDAYSKYFGDVERRDTMNGDVTEEKMVCSISESAAPYRYYSNKRGAKTDVVTIDVGGGTTDVFVVEDGKAKMLLSFRFASNAIFGDGYNGSTDTNGFVATYKGYYEELLEKNELESLKQTLNQISVQGKSTDIITFLFSLVGDKVKNNSAFDFRNQLSKNEKLRYVFVLFYGSILYFIAKSMKAKGINKPLTLAFSGNGAHSLRIVSTDKEVIGRFSQLIFDGVYDGTFSDRSMHVIIDDEPKKATCKGGIIDSKQQSYDEIKNIKTVYLGHDFSGDDNNKMTYAHIDDEVKSKVLDSEMEFFDFFFNKVDRENDNFFCDYLGVDPSIYDKVKKLCTDRIELEQSLKKGLELKMKGMDDKNCENTNVEETLFFYPLINVLHDIAQMIGGVK